MKQIRKILSIRLTDPTASVRTIAKITTVSRPVVKDYLDRLERSEINIDTLHTMDDTALQEQLGLSGSALQETDTNRKLWEWLEKNLHRLQKPNMTRMLLHEDYRKAYPEGLQYSQFCFVLQQRYHSPEASSLLVHKAGDKMFVDFTGQKARWNCSDGKDHVEEVFLAVMGASGAFHSIPVPSQRQEDFAHATQQAFQSFGGVPLLVVPDCLKSGVTHNDGHEALINPLFQRLLEHYGTLCLPARPKHPKDKALVEGAVNLVYRQILTRLEDQVFSDRNQMLDWWRRQVQRINLAPLQKLPGSRQSRFDTLDKPALKPLPTTTFSLETVLQQAVTPAGVVYVPDDRTYYSVPYQLQGLKVELLVFPDRVEVWHEHTRRATHNRQPQAGKVLRPEHLDPAHRWFAERNAEELVQEVGKVGPHIASWAHQVVETSGHADLAWARLTGLQKLIRQNQDRMDTVCRLALRHQKYSLKELRQILLTEEDRTLKEEEQLTPELALHENVRGPDYWETQGVGA